MGFKNINLYLYYSSLDFLYAWKRIRIKNKKLQNINQNFFQSQVTQFGIFSMSYIALNYLYQFFCF